MSITRRVFLKSGGLAVIGTAAIPAFLTRAAYAAESLGVKNKRLVVIFQRGAADGLNIVVPHHEPRTMPCGRPSTFRATLCSISMVFSGSILRSGPFSRCGSSAIWRSCTPPDRPTPLAPTSTRRTLWNRERPA